MDDETDPKRTPARCCDQRYGVHVWRINLDESRLSVSAVERMLDATEVARANRFLRTVDRHRYVIRRAAVRMILSSYLDISPVSVRLENDDRGKPRLGEGMPSTRLRFNVSKAGGLALCAVGFGAEIGVDVVDIDAAISVTVDGSTGECGALPERKCRKRENVLRGWVRTEAQLKACGTGLSGLSEATGKVLPGWFCYELGLGPGYVGALVTKQADQHIEYYSFSPSTLCNPFRSAPCRP